MRSRSRRGIVIGSILACLAGGAAAAQDKPVDSLEALRERARTDKKAVVASVVELTESEARVFWPVYNAYQSDMIGHYDRVLGFLDSYAKAYDTMTDETATKLLTQFLALERDRVALLDAYVPRFRKVLSAKKVARLYQIENKLRAIVHYELAREIPFLK
jgi:hypothetical protein